MSSAQMLGDVPAVTVMDSTRKRTSRPATLVAESLWKSYRMGAGDVHALRGLNLRVGPGELVAVMGPSGCGKSTLLHALGGLLSPSSGSVVVEGENLATMSDGERTELRRRRIGFVFQRFNLFPALTVDGNLRLAQRIAFGRRHPSAGVAHRRDLLWMLGLSKKRDHKPMELSGGEQQRVALARAIIHNPAILLADEPTGNLDSESSDNVLSMLKRIHAELGQTIVLITHDIDVAEQAERVVRMKDGAIVD